MCHHDVGERPEEALEHGRLPVHQLFRPVEGPARSTLDQVTRQRERRSGESDQGHLELLHEEPDRLRHVRLIGVRIQSPEPRHAGGVPDRLVQRRSSSRLDPHRHADRGERHHDVGEQDRGVEGHAPERLQRELDHLLGASACLEDVRAPTKLSVLGEVSAGLSHEPHGRAVHGLASERAQQTIVRRGSGHTLRIRSVRSSMRARLPGQACRSGRLPTSVHRVEAMEAVEDLVSIRLRDTTSRVQDREPYELGFPGQLDPDRRAPVLEGVVHADVEDPADVLPIATCGLRPPREKACGSRAGRPPGLPAGSARSRAHLVVAHQALFEASESSMSTMTRENY